MAATAVAGEGKTKTLKMSTVTMHSKQYLT